MIKMRSGGRRGPLTRLIEAPGLIVHRSRDGMAKGWAIPVPGDVAVVLRMPAVGVTVLQLTDDASCTLGEVQAALRADPATRFVGRVLVDTATNRAVLYTENLFIKFVDTAARQECRRALATYTLTVRKVLGYARNSYFVAAQEGVGQRVFALAEELLWLPQVEFCHPELVALSWGLGEVGSAAEPERGVASASALRSAG